MKLSSGSAVVAAAAAIGVVAPGAVEERRPASEATRSPGADCPPPRPGWYDPAEPDAARTEVTDAALLAGSYGRMHRSRVQGVAACGRAGTVLVYRVPGSTKLDDALVRLVRRWTPADVRVQFVDVAFSGEEVDALTDDVTGRVPALHERGVDVDSLGFVAGDTMLTIRVRSDLGQAREALADLGNRVRVLRETTPAFDRPTRCLTDPPACGSRWRAPTRVG